MNCPHCGQPISHAPVEIVALARSIHLPRRERLAIDAMLEIWPRLARKDYLVAAMYDAVGEDCEQPESVVESHISKLRAKLKPHGWAIENERFLGYRLVKDNTFGTGSSLHSSSMEIAK